MCIANCSDMRFPKRMCISLSEQASQYCHPIGDDRFKQQVEQRYGIKLGQAARGRPIKRKENG